MKLLPSAVKRRVGIASFSTEQVKRAIESKSRLFFSCFTPHEIEYCKRKKRAAESFAARIASKMAFWDACDIKNPEKIFKRTEWKKVAVERKKLGPPELAVSASILKTCKLPRECRLLLSITHEREFALAVVMIES